MIHVSLNAISILGEQEVSGTSRNKTRGQDPHVLLAKAFHTSSQWHHRCQQGGNADFEKFKNLQVTPY